MTLATPVLTSREGVAPELAGDADLLVDPYDTADVAEGIGSLDGDATLRAGLAQRGSRRARLFPAERFRQDLRQVYERL